MHLLIITTHGNRYTVNVPCNKDAKDVIRTVRDYGITTNKNKSHVSPAIIERIETRPDANDDPNLDDEFYEGV